ncbi:MAG TPA: FecR family protein, partial [Acidobacteriaceae bacterium]
MLDTASFRRMVFASALVVAGMLLPVTAPAQDAASAPTRAARLTSSHGTVTVTDGDNPAVPAQMNLPLLQGVEIATGNDGQAEIEFEDGSIARLTPNSTLSLDRLDIAPGQLFITDLSMVRGLAYFELRATPEYVYSVNVGGDAVSPVENATVRIDFDQPPASIAVLDGTVQVQRTNGVRVDVIAGETLSGNVNDPSRYSLTQEIAADSWDQWNADMDQQAAQQSSDSTSVRDDYAGAQGYGWGDLDSSGTWYDVPGQGQVWQPYAADASMDFDPYGNGAWVWYPGTGYLWASAYPWGWTPYRCGAWSYYDSFGWGWAPGASCGGFGWGFAGGGFAVNIVRWPRGYQPVRVPVRRPGPVRPVLPVRITTVGRERTWNGSPPERRERQIAGLTARPITPGHMTFAAGGGASFAVGASGSLHRDFPIDRRTH